MEKPFTVCSLDRRICVVSAVRKPFDAASRTANELCRPARLTSRERPSGQPLAPAHARPRSPCAPTCPARAHPRTLHPARAPPLMFDGPDRTSIANPAHLAPSRATAHAPPPACPSANLRPHMPLAPCAPQPSRARIPAHPRPAPRKRPSGQPLAPARACLPYILRPPRALRTPRAFRAHFRTELRHPTRPHAPPARTSNTADATAPSVKPRRHLYIVVASVRRGDHDMLNRAGHRIPNKTNHAKHRENTRPQAT